MTDEQQSAARLADRGAERVAIDALASCPAFVPGEDGEWFEMGTGEIADELRQAMHDRDRYHREAAYWRGEAERLRREPGDSAA